MESTFLDETKVIEICLISLLRLLNRDPYELERSYLTVPANLKRLNTNDLVTG